MIGPSLAIETTSHVGHVALANAAGQVLATRSLAKRRHNVELLPAIDTLCNTHHIAPTDLRLLAVSLGPGSFTGIRIGIATTAMLALALPMAKVVGVPTLDVLARQAANEQPGDAGDGGLVAACLNVKRGTAWSAIYRIAGSAVRDTGGVGEPEPAMVDGPRLLDRAGLVAAASQHRQADEPVTVIGPMLAGDDDAHDWPADWRVVQGDAALPSVAVLMRLGQQRARAGELTNPWTLAPIYGREPEAVTLWRQRQARIGSHK